jgi:site-specific recombinase
MDSAHESVSSQGQRSIAVARPAHPALVRQVEAFCGATDRAQLAARFVGLVRWIEMHDSGRSFTQREALLDYLETHPEVRSCAQQRLGELLNHSQFISLFAESGVPSDRPFVAELVRRIVGTIVPSAREQGDAARLVVLLYSSRRDAQHFLDMPETLFARLASALTPKDDGEFWGQPRQDMREALRLLAARVCSLGLKPEMRERSGVAGIFHSPFFQLMHRTEGVIRPEGELRERLVAWHSAVSRCREDISEVYQHMETTGVSVELVFDLKKIDACLMRMELLIGPLEAETHDDAIPAVKALMGQLVTGRISDRSVGTYLRDNLNLLARKTVERTGRSGEHYIAYNREEYWQMWRAAIGGGFLTVITAAFKLRIHEAHVAPFVEGFAAGLNYAVSFIFLQILHLVLATKQPAATAATFAGIVRNNRGQERLNKFAEFVERITRTQLAAALGNVLAVSLGAVLFARLWQWIYGHPFLPEETATHVYETLNVFNLRTAIYAVVTGVVLWMAALAGGWCENFAVFYRLPQAIAEHPLGLRVGRERMQKIARVIDRNLGGWATCIVLGFLLGFTPEIGHFFGLPLDVRHVTLSTGQLALAAARFGTGGLSSGWLHRAIGGIGIIFILNLSVSFTIAATVALRAYNVSFKEQLGILRYLVEAALRTPLRFIYPVREHNAPAQKTAQLSENPSNDQHAA